MVSYGTNDSIERLVETYSGMLLRLASTRLRNTMDAEDAVQEVFLYLIEHGVTFKSAEHEKAWLIRATLHRVSDFTRRASEKEIPYEDLSDRGTAPPEASLLEELRSLPETYAAVLYLLGDALVRDPSLLLRLRGVTLADEAASAAKMTLPLWKGATRLSDALAKIYRRTEGV